MRSIIKSMSCPANCLKSFISQKSCTFTTFLIILQVSIQCPCVYILLIGLALSSSPQANPLRPAPALASLRGKPKSKFEEGGGVITCSLLLARARGNSTLRPHSNHHRDKSPRERSVLAPLPGQPRIAQALWSALLSGEAGMFWFLELVVRKGGEAGSAHVLQQAV
jgi:hypothetical protein